MIRQRIALLAMAAGMVAGSGAAAQPAAAATVPELYVHYCAMCHLPGIAGAPKVGDRAEWTRRLRAGMNWVYRNALEGVPNTAMMAKGGHKDLKDAEIRAIVDYMLAAANLPPDALAAAARYDKLGIASRDFVRLDVNLDGFLSREELAGDAVLLAGYARFDANGDGRLSSAEYEAAEAALERERMAVRAEDPALVAAVRKAIGGIKGVDAANTKVESVNGVVSIVGIVEDAVTAVRAQDAVKRIPGVQKIDNRLVSGHQMGWD